MYFLFDLKMPFTFNHFYGMMTKYENFESYKATPHNVGSKKRLLL